MLKAPEKPTVFCSCGKGYAAKPAKGGGFRSPKGWKQTAEGLLCRDCIKGAYLPRRIRLRIVGPADDRDWQHLGEALRNAAEDVRRLSNFYVRKLFEADTNPLLPDGKLSPAVRFSSERAKELYREAAEVAPRLAPAQRCQAMQSVAGHYNSDRFEFHVAGKRSVRSYTREEMPIPVHPQCWRLTRGDDGKLQMRLQFAPGKAYLVKVSGDGINLGRALQLLSGEAKGGVAYVRRVTREITMGGTAVRKKAWMVAISSLVPKVTTKKRAATKEMTLGHDAAALWYGVIEGEDEPFEFPALELKSRIAAANRLAKAIRQEKSALRWTGNKRKARRLDSRQSRLLKKNRWLESQIAFACATLRKRCVASGVEVVNYDITDRGYLPNFPWRRLRDTLRVGLENVGITLHVLGSDGELTDGKENMAAQAAMPGLAGPTRDTDQEA